MLKVDTYREDANTGFAVVVMNTEAFPTKEVKESLTDCLKEYVSYNEKIGEAQKILKKIQVHNKQKKVATEYHYFKLDRRVKLPQGMTLEIKN